MTERVSFKEVAKNPQLARAARAELDGEQHSTAIETEASVSTGAYEVCSTGPLEGFLLACITMLASHPR